MVNKCEIFIFFVCLLAIFPSQTLQQKKSTKNAHNLENEEDKRTSDQDGVHWKSVAIVVLSVVILGAICYGSNCLYICQMTLCKRPEGSYTKMDLTSQV